ncbi:Sec23/Sec24 trunk domain-containing protein [Suillus discolor]|uniref:Sec23/Sec24 trunk domain-containing protein n=1 Tax=Suillus discolor TaxID=1912936 RepID=A0A9P7FBQ5_9AGAM|nr:Sec23/Sec24 trunk domain-containing protein [Suillus discolor]KAG2111951.1 Sec23/Sec24 trunk domain-containing protein [Suillus discolor]
MHANRHIPQPPHSAGEPYKGTPAASSLWLRPRIDPSQMPSPIDMIESDKEKWEGNSFMTLPGNNPPLSTSDFTAFDQGNSSPKHVRCFQPFADLDPREEPIPVVDCGDSGPPRCKECRGYINPWCAWTAGGWKWKCNLCGHETQVLPDYFCNLDANLMRIDLPNRPELNKGTVDFVVSGKEYWAPPPLPKMNSSLNPLNCFFAFDVSLEAIRSGFLKATCDVLRDMLYGSTSLDGTLPEPSFPKDSQLAILTYDTSLHFYDLSPASSLASMIVVSDLEEVFVPLREGLFVDPWKSRTAIEGLLKALPERYLDTVIDNAALGGALLAGLASLAGRGGHIIAFQSVLPVIGPGALEPLHDQASLYGTEKERTMFLPRHQTWRDIAEECSEEGIGVSMFLGMSKPIDIGSIGIVSSTTGGELFFHPRFNPARDQHVLTSQLRRLLTRTTVYNCLLRVRCSNGLRISNYYGNFHERSVSDLDIGILDSDKAISVHIEHSRKLDAREYAFLQCAVLHTTPDGQRRVRTCNLALEVADLAANVFRYADMDAVVCHLARESMSKLTSRRMAHIREELTDRCSSLLLGYRRNCAAATAVSQLIIPEAFRALPVYTLAIMKCKPLKGRNVSADVRNYHAQRILSMSVRATMQHLYPRLLALHDLADDTALPDPTTGQMSFPSLMRDSHTYMEAHGVYLIDNEDLMIFWVGSSVSPQLLLDLFGVDDLLTLDPNIIQLPVLHTRLSAQVRNILTHRHAQRGRTPKMLLVRQNMDGTEIEFSDMLVEDQNNAAMSYLDCEFHLTNGEQLSGGPSLRGSPW